MFWSQFRFQIYARKLLNLFHIESETDSGLPQLNICLQTYSDCMLISDAMIRKETATCRSKMAFIDVQT